MHKSLSLLAIAGLFAPLTAQDMEMPKPAPELAKFERMVGEWEGSGTALMQADAPAAPWTATLSFRKILDGFFYAEDLSVHFGDPSAAPMQLKQIYAWDGENNKYMVYMVSNMGEISANQLHLIDGGFMQMQTGLDLEGNPTLARSITRYTDDGFSYESSGCSGTSPYSTHVSGTFRKAGGQVSTKLAEASFMNAEPSPALAKLDKWIGTWKMKGSMVMAPGMPEMEIGGTETVKPIWGGTVIQSTIIGDPDPTSGYVYKGIGFMAYNKSKGCIDYVFAENMGMSGVHDCNFVGKHMVITAATKMMGQPAASRTLIEFGDDGPKHVVSHLLSGTAAPLKNFDATYERAK